MHHTKQKGDLGVLKAQLDLFEQGFTILNPMTEHAPFDLVAYRDGVFHRVQVKHRKVDCNGKIEIKFSTCWADRNGTHSVPIDKDEVDLFCVYCPDTGECYYLDPKWFESSASLRVEAPKNGQQKGVRLAADFRRVP
ncbi:group I intron-associated PD-(D/E)XK endonuclease [Wenzhouxiangella sp. EGI_FJ10305]|uniref:group I intron-associated PD-(D/E)XK endonuclease n=1 Tax=Wenzhouxiangella sp. EGI_FJ10305 TaxID=3243768 RepID=UPI0035DD34C9